MRAVDEVVEELLDVASGLRGIADDLGHNDIAQELVHELQHWNAGATRLVLAGEAGCGKTSLLTAVLGTEGLVAPNGAPSTVSTIFRCIPPEDDFFLGASHPWVAVADQQGSRQTDVSFNELRRTLYARERRHGGRQLLSAGVTVVRDLTKVEIAVIDTPGLGANAMAMEACLAAAGEADALIFAIDASGVASSITVEFLGQVTRRIGTVLFVLTKIDAVADWRVAVDLNGALLRTALPGLQARWLPTSARLDVQARKMARKQSDLAERLERASGVPMLRRWLDFASQDWRALRAAGIARVSETSASTLLLGSDGVAGPEAPESLEALELERARLLKAQGSWINVLRDEFYLLEVRARQEIARKAKLLDEALEGRAIATSSTTMQAFVSDLHEAMSNALTDLTSFVEVGIGEVLDRVLTHLGFRPEDFQAGDMLMAELPAARMLDPSAARAGSDQMSTVRSAQVVAASTSSTTTLLRLISPSLVAPPFGFLASIGIGGLMLKQQATAAEQGRTERAARSAVSEQTGWLRSEVPGEVQIQLLQSRRKIEETLKERVDLRLSELDEAIRQSAASPVEERERSPEDQLRAYRDQARSLEDEIAVHTSVVGFGAESRAEPISPQ
jgi:hypothetical protein